MTTIHWFEIVLSLCIGLGLAAASGFRVFVPLLVMSAAAWTGEMGLAPGFEWVGSTTALIMLATATVLEILAYYIPWLDNLLDTIASPAAVLAGILATASTLGDVSPMVRWSLALIAGGGVAAVVQAGSVGLRGASTATTGGAGNFLVATGELIMALIVSVLAVLWPVVAVALAIVIVLVLLRLATRVFFNRRQATTTQLSQT